MENPLFCPDCGMMRDSCTCRGRGRLSIFRKLMGGSEEEMETRKGIGETLRDDIRKRHPHIPSEIIENFPFPQPRPGQLDIINDIYQALEDGYRYVVLEAGTGTGKSAIACTLAGIYQPAYILTMTKQLQDQYAREFGFPVVKGRGNFLCKNEDLESSCDMGTCQTVSSSDSFHCPYGVVRGETLLGEEAFLDSYGNRVYFKGPEHCNYWEQKAEAINSPITLMNYDYAFLELNYVGHFDRRNLMILDEAHNIEDKLMKRLEVTLSNRRLSKDIKKKIPPSMLREDDPSEWVLQVEAIMDHYSDLELDSMPRRKRDRIKRTIKRLSELKMSLEDEPKNWVVDSDDDLVSFKPLRVHKYAPERLFSYSESCLFMSATILNERLFCQWLGIDPREAYFVKVDSPFPASRRPIELKIAGRMSRNRIKQTAPETIPILNRILERHRNDKGLIHTHNYRCQRFIMENIHNRRLIDHRASNREAVLRYFEETPEPLVLVSPSMSEGVDLPYDKCRFQVIYKIPFPYLGDKQVNLRQRTDQRWYAYKTIMTLMQAYGRGMRANDDSCYTYILDGNIEMIFRSPLYRSLLPEFFKEAIVNE
ncbi:helicase C-terminal domain-containing protein [Methanothermobacter wolfeii]|uniref:helicase C-terminal domain-containing protein n=1 Tax=Methanothermobacter wolfeii TaxID=145261 RepID=UPI0024B37E8A|nr:ATP-dependent DNA helicase [Methanothermobacter wolfeii]MDI6702616.1 ATP-dependent DNA helicase [Methanothermobacter wolfeii]MDI6841833.1 ATP-dependent DNA helicase [Methanothermobacter wolfeii]